MWVFLISPVLAAELPPEPTASNDSVIGGYGAPIFGTAQLDGQLVPAFGGRGGWVFHHAFVIGGFGYSAGFGDRAEASLDVSYGGLFVEGILGWRAPVHASVEAGLGLGATSRGGDELGGMVVVPHVAARAEINVAKWMRISAGPSYRFASRGDAVSGPISGPGAELLLKFGRF